MIGTLIKHGKLLFILILMILLSNFILADNAKVEINLDLNNIATVDDSSSNEGMNSIIPYKEIIKVDNYIDEQTRLGRTVKAEWHIINYEPNNDSYSNEIGGFHLFDFTWFRLRTYVEYKDKDGQWLSMGSTPTAFNLEPYSEAMVYSYGDMPVIISPTICPGEICIGGGGEQQNKFQEEVVKKIEKKDYRISIIKYPVIKSVYLMLNDSSLIGKKLEMEGTFNLGDSAIVTQRKPALFPFDKYSLELIYSSYYDSKVNFNIKNIEDLSLSSKKETEFSTVKGENKSLNFYLIRNQPIRSIFWNIFLILIPFILYGLERKWEGKQITRILTYLFAFVTLIFTLTPKPLNVPTFNILNIFTWTLYIVLIANIEVTLFRQRNKNK